MWGEVREEWKSVGGGKEKCSGVGVGVGKCVGVWEEVRKDER